MDIRFVLLLYKLQVMKFIFIFFMLRQGLWVFFMKFVGVYYEIMEVYLIDFGGWVFQCYVYQCFGDLFVVYWQLVGIGLVGDWVDDF